MTRTGHGCDPDETEPTIAIAVHPGPRRTRAQVSGEMDADNQDDVRAALGAALDSSTSGLDLDLSALTFCDSAGLHLLIDLQHAAATTGKTLVLHAPSPQLNRLLALTGAAPLFTVHAPPAHPSDPHDDRHCVTGGNSTGPSHHWPHAIDAAVAYDDEP
ncbi:STAS domain-containing protein [Streptomyces goshikiensis]|uniref:STAS domain-containing protein n=1 Tax=Streptomyces goshikiensis TaxID=1942 RepID=UPI00367BFC1B